MNRLFAGLIIPEEIKKVVVNLRRSIDDSDLKWEEKDKFHITLKFIGEVDDNKRDLIIKKLNILSGYNKLTASISGFNFFYRDNKPSILWLRLNIDTLIYKMFDDIENELEGVGIEKERRRFKPHLNILRIKKNIGNDFVKKFTDLKVPEIKFYVTEAGLFLSELTPISSKYTLLKKYTLSDQEDQKR